MAWIEERPRKDDSELMAVLADEAAPRDRRQEACSLLVDRHYRAMLRRATAELAAPHADLAEDVVQEVVALLLWSAKARRFDRRRPLGPWLLQVVTRKARDVRRQERRHLPASALDQEVIRPRSHPPEPPLEPDNLAAVLRRLSCGEREITQLFYLDELSAHDVAQRLSWPIGKVYRELHRIRTKLRGLMVS